MCIDKKQIKWAAGGQIHGNRAVHQGQELPAPACSWASKWAVAFSQSVGTSEAYTAAAMALNLALVRFRTSVLLVLETTSEQEVQLRLPI